MGSYEHTTTVATDPQTLFDFLTEVSNLPDYFDGMVEARPLQGNSVHVVAEVEGERRQGEAWIEADAPGFTLRWGSQGPNDYHGELAVTATDDGGAQVTVTLNTERADSPGIRAGLEQTLANIKRLVEGSSTQRA